MPEAPHISELLPGAHCPPIELVRLSSVEGMEAGGMLPFLRGDGHTGCFQILSVDPEARQVKAVQLPVMIVKKKGAQWKML